MTETATVETAKTREDAVLAWLRRFGPLASCQFNDKERTGYSERTLATGINNLVHRGLVECVGKIKGYKIWGLRAGQGELFA